MATKRWLGIDSGNEGDYGTAANWTASGVPGSADDVFFTATNTQAVTATLDQSAVAIDEFRVEAGSTGAMGSATGYLIIDPNRVVWEGTGESYVDTGTTASKDVTIKATASALTGKSGLYLLGTVGVLSVASGRVAYCGLAGEPDPVTAVRTTAATANVLIGVGATVTNIDCHGGVVTNRSVNATTDVKIYGGEVVCEGLGAITNVNVYDGTFTGNAAGTITNLYVRGGTADFTKMTEARTITNVYLYRGGTFVYDPDYITVTTFNGSDGPATITASAI